MKNKNITITKDPSKANAITHSGVFHADEVFATVILSKLVNNLTVLRTFKVPADINDNVLIYDIGGGKFDHHQKGGNGARENGVPYSSCGLIWKEYGHQIVATFRNPDLVWDIVDKDIIQSIDAIDNGVLPKLDYPARVMSLSATISSFNPNWDSTDNHDDCFLKAVEFAEIIFNNVLETSASKARAQDIVENAIKISINQIMILHKFVPWQDFLLNSTNPDADKILFVIYPSNRGGFNWQCVPDEVSGFGQRKPVPKEWRGLNGEELQKVTGVSTATFCHPSGFIGGATTLSGAIELAKISINS